MTARFLLENVRTDAQPTPAVDGFKTGTTALDIQTCVSQELGMTVLTEALFVQGEVLRS